jgi:peptidoglycan hydrolase-like protein with peptidoglycan-binding domain
VVGPGAGFGHATGAQRVRLIQRKLTAEGFSPGPLDGLYGPLTTAAVMRFQRSRGLAPDGMVGPITRKALNSGGESPGAGTLTARGSSAVRSLQRRLARAGFSPGPVDGRYGPRTTSAVRRFQRAHRLAPNGIASQRTLQALGGQRTLRRRPATGSQQGSKPKHRSAARSPQGAAPGPNPASAPKSHSRGHYHFQLIATLLLGAIGVGLLATLLVRPRRRRRRLREAPEPAPNTHDEQTAPTSSVDALPQPSERVRELQDQLIWLGFDPGPVDGRYGPLTTEAVRRFQQSHDLPTDGIAGPDTEHALQRGNVQRNR